jgi:DNA-binding response OmpR family regulator
MVQKLISERNDARLEFLARQAGDKERALEVGFDGYLTKLVNIATLIDDIRVTL